MKSTDTKSAAVALQTKSEPFLAKERQGDFFSHTQQKSSFFKTKNTAPRGVQAKLTVGQPNDPYEKEADSVANQVVQRLSEPATIQRKPAGTAPLITPVVQLKCAACEHEKDLQKKEEKEDKAGKKEKLQLKPIFASNAEPPDDDPKIQRKCAACEKEEKLQKKSDTAASNTASASVESSLTLSKGGGSPLPDNTRTQMEGSFGTDFSAVRVHTDSSAVQMNKDLSAQAFTHGSDIYFNAGKYKPADTDGQRLLAHELTHTVQQKAASVGSTINKGWNKSNNPALNSQIQKKGLSDDEQKTNIAEAIKKKDIGLIKDLNAFRFDLADENQKFQMIRILLDQTWVGPNDEYYLEKIWGSFRLRLPEVLSLNDNFVLWNACIERGANLYAIPELLGLKLKFQQDVINISLGYLTINQDKANKEKERYGLNNIDKAPDAKQTQELTGIGKKVQDAKKILDIQARFRNITVGYRPNYSRAPIERFPEAFDPATKPVIPLDHESPPFLAWSRLKVSYDKLSAIIDGYVAQYPAIYALIQDQKVDKIKDKTDQKLIQRSLLESLNALLGNIDKARNLLTDPKSKFPLELDPIHKQLFDSKTSPWSAEFPKIVAKKFIEEHGNIKFWESLGIGAIQLGLFVVAELTTGGLATFFFVAGAAGSVGLAADSWKNYLDSKALANASLSRETSLLSAEKADDALLEAVINTAFAVLDLYGAGKAVAGGLKNEAELGKKLAKLEGEEGAKVESLTTENFEKTKSIPSDELSSSDAVFENSWVNENIGKAKKSEIIGYDIEVKLPNDHIWRRNKEGNWCRFSEPGFCFIFGEGPTLRGTHVEIFPQQRKPLNGEWSGTPGNSEFTPHDSAVWAQINYEAIPFVKGYPDFSRWRVGNKVFLPESVMAVADRNLHFAQADRILAERNGLLYRGTPSAAAAERFRSAQHLTWHHNEQGYLELIPSAIHDIAQHEGWIANLP